jgi:hypothetical protein
MSFLEDALWAVASWIPDNVAERHQPCQNTHITSAAKRSPATWDNMNPYEATKDIIYVEISLCPKRAHYVANWSRIRPSPYHLETWAPFNRQLMSAAKNCINM